MSVCPMSAQPPMPPVMPDATFATPCPTHSDDVLPCVPSSTSPSTNCSVSSDSITPTAAMVRLYGSTSANVLRASGTAGSARLGTIDRPPLNVSAPAMSASVVAGRFNPLATAVTRTMDNKLAGTAVVMYGMILISAAVAAVSPTMVAPLAPVKSSPVTASWKCDHCALAITMASPFTKPRDTG